MVRKWSCRMHVCFSRARWKFLKLHQCQVILFLTLKKRLVLAVVFLSGFFFFFFKLFVHSLPLNLSSVLQDGYVELQQVGNVHQKKIKATDCIIAFALLV